MRHDNKFGIEVSQFVVYNSHADRIGVITYDPDYDNLKLHQDNPAEGIHEVDVPSIQAAMEMARATIRATTKIVEDRFEQAEKEMEERRAAELAEQKERLKKAGKSDIEVE